jgi:hypothetical protein
MEYRLYAKDECPNLISSFDDVNWSAIRWSSDALETSQRKKGGRVQRNGSGEKRRCTHETGHANLSYKPAMY